MTTALKANLQQHLPSTNVITVRLQVRVVLYLPLPKFLIITLTVVYAGSTSSSSGTDVEVVKATKKSSVGAKLRSKLFRPRNRGIDNNLAINSVHYKKDAKDGKYKFYAFPTYSPSDALLFLPTALASHLNSADVPSLTKLLMSHFDRECVVKLNLLQEAITTKRFIDFNHIMIDLHPDSIMCVHNTRVIDSQLCASIYAKFTDCKAIYDSVAKSVTDSLFRTVFGTQRGKSGLHERAIHDASCDVKDELTALIDGDEDLSVYVRLDLVFTIDETSRKITELGMQGQVTSVKALAVHPPEQ